ncbi:hypothetical protein N7466_006567 [Penicillium verhagenii]|uniref:uncharacterized protein n=1 Tax=Penicillium verhagenii TaxID=1562060 RepID=UPI00254570D4|nr:uncharacterized protein N7466_006567 [Penicillium verhagenii]KAJ5931074.1 hypothetical protein N7466_006567 [Penicillium verhagenii]
METETTPCSACSWTPKRQTQCSYDSHVKIFYSASTRGGWSLGSKLILRERSAAPPNFEAPNIRFLSEKTSIPIPELVETWEEDGLSFSITRRIPGKNLDEAWPTLSDEEKERIAKQTADYLGQLRGLQSTRMESVGGEPLFCNFLFGGDHGVGYGPLSSDDELWDQLALSLTHVPEEIRLKLRERMPTAAPYTFTHSDLTTVNIMVDNGNLTGIIDWENSGFFPVWWEFAAAGICLGDEDREWKNTLRKYMPEHEDMRGFFMDLWSLRRYPDLDERGLKFLKEGGFSIPKVPEVSE